MLFGVALERLTWAPGEAVCFDFVAESYSGIEFTRIQVHYFYIMVFSIHPCISTHAHIACDHWSMRASKFWCSDLRR